MAALGRKKRTALLILLSELYGRGEFAAYGTVAKVIGVKEKGAGAAVTLTQEIEHDPTMPRELATRLVDANGLLRATRRAADQSEYSPVDFLRDDDAFNEVEEGSIVAPESVVHKPKKLKKLLKERGLKKLN